MDRKRPSRVLRATTEPDIRRSTSADLDWRLGYGTGYDVGYVHGVQDEGAAWSSILTGCTSTFRSPRQDELKAVRDEVRHDPCPAKCRRCSRCYHSLDFWGRGGRHFAGLEAEALLAGAA